MKVENFVNALGADFYTGVPDSLLKPLCNFLMATYGTAPRHHVIGANEGNCVAIAAGYHLATSKIPVVYMQNSGEGNAVNPVASLLNEKVYAIPVIFVVGFRGEPGEKDEPQHIFQGEITLKLLDDLGVANFVLSAETTESELKSVMEKFRGILSEGKCVAFVVKKNALSFGGKIQYRNGNSMGREEIIERIAEISRGDPVVCTTGKAGRELFEIREKKRQDHKFDFLTVGSMGHASSIALGIAKEKIGTKIWCIDGDGAAIMHMGAMAVIGSVSPENLVHVVINNESHETVGGLPTAASKIDLIKIALGCGYVHAVRAENFGELNEALLKAKESAGLFFIEAKSSMGARENLGRPTSGARENKKKFMEYLKTLS